MLTIEHLRAALIYDPKTGLLTWRERPLEHFANASRHTAWNKTYAGTPALTAKHGAGYRHGAIFGKNLLAHRAAWAIVHGEWPKVMDHLNGDRADNRLANLRSVTQAVNARNQTRHSRNKSGVTGVFFLAKQGRWLSAINADCVHHHLGVFDTLEEAAEARKDAERRLGFTERHGEAA